MQPLSSPSTCHSPAPRGIHGDNISTRSQSSQDIFSSANCLATSTMSAIFDFPSSHSYSLNSSPSHTRSMSPTPISCSPASFTSGSFGGLDYSYNHIHALEKDFCSNFSCCGLSLPSMHELLDHFEESHVVIIGKDGRPIYPHSPMGISPTSSSALASCFDPHVQQRCSSIVVSYPQPHPPLSLDIPLPPSQPLDADPSLHSSPSLDLSDVLSDFDPFDYDQLSSGLELAFSSKSSSPIQKESISLPPAISTALQTTPHSPSPSIPANPLPPSQSSVSSYVPHSSHIPKHHQYSDVADVLTPPLSPSSSTSALSSSEGEYPIPRQRKRVIGRPRGRVFEHNGRRARLVDHTTLYSSTTSSQKKDREKTYKCPHTGCSKSYLNPNGLKYHLEKGTCTIDPSRPSFHPLSFVPSPSSESDILSPI